ALLPSDPMPSAPAIAKMARPQMTLTPRRKAPAAPAEAAFGMAWAANGSPRSTAKKPVIPAITATMLAAIQVLAMRPVNIRLENTRHPHEENVAAVPCAAALRRTVG